MREFLKRIAEHYYPSPEPRPKDLPLFYGRGRKPALHIRASRPDELALGLFADDDTHDMELKGIPAEHRAAHFYVVGASGTGKTKFLEALINQDMEHGNGFGVVDAHGDLTEDIKGMLYIYRAGRPDRFSPERIVLIDPFDPEYTACFNPLERAGGASSAATAGEVVEAFKKIWSDAWGARMEDLLKNSLIALIENDLTLAELPLFLSDIAARKKILKKVSHPVCIQYFERFNSLRASVQEEWAESTLNKVQAFLSDGRVRQIFLSQKSTVNFREIMDSKKILLVKLDRGRLHGSADILGSLILAKIQAAAFSRTDIPQDERVPFYLYIDEFQNFATENFIRTLAEARKYRLSLILAHQNLAQLPAALRASVLSNCGLQAYFRISRDDANIMARESFASVFKEPVGWDFYVRSLQELGHREFVAKNKIAGGVMLLHSYKVDAPHSLLKMDARTFAEKVAEERIGKNYLRKRKDIEEECRKRREKLLGSDEPESFAEKK